MRERTKLSVYAYQVPDRSTRRNPPPPVTHSIVVSAARIVGIDELLGHRKHATGLEHAVDLTQRLDGVRDSGQYRDQGARSMPASGSGRLWAAFATCVSTFVTPALRTFSRTMAIICGWRSTAMSLPSGPTRRAASTVNAPGPGPSPATRLAAAA